MKQTYCNPLDLGYRYQHMKEGSRAAGFREGADPTLVYFKGTYYMFVSMSAGFWHSCDLLHWDFHADPDLLIYDYAPDVRQVGDYLYFCASRKGRNCPVLRTKDPLTEPFTEVSAVFEFWDPDLFWDDDGRVYFYWGCSNTSPIWGVELDPGTMTPIGEKKELVFGREETNGYERPGDNGVVNREASVLYRSLKPFYDETTGELHLPPQMAQAPGINSEALTAMFGAIGKPYIEGVFMTKHNGIYYLQYACPGTQFNTYCDGVYTAKSPLGPFTQQQSNPFSAKPGGFITGAGHGSTIADRYGNWWHAATMRISVNHDFERRVGLFPAGFDKDGVLFCNQNFADYPHEIPTGRFDAAAQQPAWMLLSYKKPVTASSTAADSAPALAVNEDCRSWWSAGSAQSGEWLCVDLGQASDVRAIQVNLADEKLVVDFPADSYGDDRKTRHIETRTQISCYKVESSLDGKIWTLREDVARECCNGYYEYAQGLRARYVRVTGGELPYGQALRISGLRVFGNGAGEKPPRAKAAAARTGPLDGRVRWKHIENAQGCNVRYGTDPEKLYQSWLVYDADEAVLSTLVAGQDYYVCVDSFNENGITPGETIKMER
ncbi:MAG: family 43 glycosylhydrolase [Subdoligranulum sp.]|nr:family 43 glycosylhydrolase [Subdoligranulum sp.]